MGVGYNIKLPAKMDSFLKNSTNKEDLFTFLSQGVHSLDTPAQKHLYITIKDSVIAKGVTDIGSCDHEESDTRVMVHIVLAIMNGSRSVFLSTVDSDVVIISTYVFSVLIQAFPYLQMWILFGQRKNLSVYKVNKIYESLGATRCRALLFVVAFTGCDTTSQFVGKGKISAWNTWLAYPVAIDGFMIHPFETIILESEKFQIIEKYVCILYDRTTNITSVNKLRESMFPKKEFSQLTQAALFQHARRSVYQASIWLKCMENKVDPPDPSNFGWRREEAGLFPIGQIFLLFLLNVVLC